PVLLLDRPRPPRRPDGLRRADPRGAPRGRRRLRRRDLRRDHDDARTAPARRGGVDPPDGGGTDRGVVLVAARRVSGDPACERGEWMTSDPATCAPMAGIRSEIDSLDREIVALLARRAAWIDRAVVVKRDERLPARIAARGGAGGASAPCPPASRGGWRR